MTTEGLSEDFPVEKLASGTVFWLILVYGFLTFLDKLNLETVAQPVNSFLRGIFAYLPKLGAALGFIILAWVLARLAKLGIGGVVGVIVGTHIADQTYVIVRGEGEKA
ncbi:mechanosensitive ion channel family protein [Congregibacter sp.]|uniref:mechanosensitive ion channel family protein n=1 Tax=Congregibacter sp. TaxID=2744308 RepID=UPI003F6AAA00